MRIDNLLVRLYVTLIAISLLYGLQSYEKAKAEQNKSGSSAFPVGRIALSHFSPAL